MKVLQKEYAKAYGAAAGGGDAAGASGNSVSSPTGNNPQGPAAAGSDINPHDHNESFRFKQKSSPQQPVQAQPVQTRPNIVDVMGWFGHLPPTLKNADKISQLPAKPLHPGNTFPQSFASHEREDWGKESELICMPRKEQFVVEIPF